MGADECGWVLVVATVESERLRNALGISKDYQEGSHWQRQKEREEKKAQQAFVPAGKNSSKGGRARKRSASPARRRSASPRRR